MTTRIKSVLTALLFGALVFARPVMAAEEEAGTPATDSLEELRTQLGVLTAQLNDMKDKTAQFNIEGFSDVRYDSQKYTGAAKIYDPKDPKTTRLFDAKEGDTKGVYDKRAEIKMSGLVAPSVIYSLGYDFAANKLKDAGIEFASVNLLPYTGIEGWSASVKVGQYRQKFGIEPQTSSSKIDFAERAMMYGGANPFGSFTYGTVSYTAIVKGTKTVWIPNGSGAYAQATTPTSSDNWLTSGPVLSVNVKTVGERDMGVHLFHQKDLGFLKYDIGASLVNDQIDDQAVGQSSLSGAFPSQLKDPNPSVVSRFGLEPSILNSFLPCDGRTRFGVSYTNDSQNQDPLFANNNLIARQEIVGVDGIFEMFKALRLQAEWIGANQFGQLPFANQNTGIYFTDKTADSVVSKVVSLSGDGRFGLVNRSEGWYGTASLKPLNFVMNDAPSIELLGRYEGFIPNVHNWSEACRTNTTVDPGKFILKGTYQPYAINAATFGLKWTYAGNCNTAVNYTVYGINNNFGAAAGTELTTVQQQFAF